jgi:hypothetical protein
VLLLLLMTNSFNDSKLCGLPAPLAAACWLLAAG